MISALSLLWLLVLLLVVAHTVAGQYYGSCECDWYGSDYLVEWEYCNGGRAICNYDGSCWCFNYYGYGTLYDNEDDDDFYANDDDWW
jgi:hypothetical protein